MFHMLTCFNLKPEFSIEAFQHDLDRFSAELVESGLLQATGPIGRRQRHPVMDTDDERNHEYFFIMSFADRHQCDLAVARIYPGDSAFESGHQSVLSAVVDPIFICWEDVAAGSTSS